MNKQEYLSELEAHLASLSQEERTNALQFYEEYFEDAGPENEQQVISELGKPFALAKSIICEQSAYSKSKSYANYKASISANYSSSAEPDIEPDVAPDTAPQQPHTQYTAYNYADQSTNASNNNTDEKIGSYDRYKESHGGSSNNENQYTSDSSNNNGYDNSYKRDGSYNRSYTSSSNSSDSVGLILFILLIVFFIAPVVITIACVAFGLLLAALGCLIGTVVVLLAALFKMSGFMLGGAILCAGLTMLFLSIGLLLGAKLIPKTVKWTVQTVRKLSGGAV